MIIMARAVHQIIRSHPVLDTLRRMSKRGKEVVVYRHSLTRQYILAETNGRVTRELAVLPGWPNLPQLMMRQLVKQLRPLPYTQRSKMRAIQKNLRIKAERNRNCGRFVREMMFNVQKKTKGVKKDHPAINWPKIPGEGV